ncbi:non-specific lipid transfer protein GPI-anchored 7 [Argentina anserina]|uniref:non-specific lipid transfer protein GPI-anchored 7 n=1 Tax=Argentina anserina TaxID=57926 RepID=UPI0021765043|nr:non-specific lipid transfer protein GPI-anchored 7 [Potentilla anserina]
MGCRNISTLTAMVVAVVVLSSIAIPTTKAQEQSCANDLLPCGDYLNNTNQPSTACCTAINETVSTQLTCLCNLYFNSNVLQSLGATTESALRVATACGVDSVDVNQCKALLGQAPAVSPPTAVPGGDGGSGSVKIAWTGLPALLLFWASLMYY